MRHMNSKNVSGVNAKLLINLCFRIDSMSSNVCTYIRTTQSINATWLLCGLLHNKDFNRYCIVMASWKATEVLQNLYSMPSYISNHEIKGDIVLHLKVISMLCYPCHQFLLFLYT